MKEKIVKIIQESIHYLEMMFVLTGGLIVKQMQHIQHVKLIVQPLQLQHLILQIVKIGIHIVLLIQVVLIVKKEIVQMPIYLHIIMRIVIIG